MKTLNATPLLLCCGLLAGCMTTTQRPAPVSSLGTPAPVVVAPQAKPEPPPLAGGAVVKAALDQRGVPYRYGGTAPEVGFDCSGLVWYVFGRQGVHLPRIVAGMAAKLPPVDRRALRPGDLVFFNSRGPRFSHVGIYIGDNRFVHAPSKRTGRVIVSSMNNPYWRPRFTGVRRVPAATSI